MSFTLQSLWREDLVCPVTCDSSEQDCHCCHIVPQRLQRDAGPSGVSHRWPVFCPGCRLFNVTGATAEVIHQHSIGLQAISTATRSTTELCMELDRRQHNCPTRAPEREHYQHCIVICHFISVAVGVAMYIYVLYIDTCVYRRTVTDVRSVQKMQ